MRVYYIEPKRKRDYNEYDVESTIEKFNRGYFDLVADVVSEDLEDAYRLTQNGEYQWVQNRYVISYATSVGQTRSSMVGDVICQGEGINRKFYAIASCGFTRLEGIDI